MDIINKKYNLIKKLCQLIDDEIEEKGSCKIQIEIKKKDVIQKINYNLDEKKNYNLDEKKNYKNIKKKDVVNIYFL